MTNAEQTLLHRFPKHRPELPPSFQAIYDEHLSENRRGATTATKLSSRLERWMHERAARALPGTKGPWRLLELGAGNLNHVSYEKNLVIYDVVEPMRSLYENVPELDEIDGVYDSLGEVPSAARYDKILSIAVLEHVCELPALVADAALRLGPDGVFFAGVPSEGTLLWTLGWKLTTGQEFRRRHGLDYSVLMRYEHVNTAAEILSVVRVFFEDVRLSVFGLSRGLSLYQAIEARRPRREDCKRYLSGLKKD